MMIFYTSSTQHLASDLSFEQGRYLKKQFSDGEWYIKLESDVNKKNIWVVTATNPPADNIIELLLLLNALQRAGAQVHLLFTYFGYARQDQPLMGEAASAELFCNIFKMFSLKKIVIIHAHSIFLQEYLNFENVLPLDLICKTTQSYQSVAAPDQGAYELVKQVAQHCNVQPIFLSKIRPEQELVQILEYDGIVRTKNILIVDDMITTGNTIIEVAKMLKKLGATHVSVWATHGIFSGNAIESIERSDINKIYVTNTLPQHKSLSKIEVINIAPLIEKIIKNY